MAVVSVGAAERMAVVDNVVNVRARYVDDAVVSGARRNGVVELKNLVEALKGADGTVRDGVGDGVVGAGPAALAPEEVVLAIALQHLASLDVVLRRDFLEDFAILKGSKANHVLVELGHVGVSVPAVVDVRLPVVVEEDVLVNGLGAVVVFANERLADGVLVGAFWAVCDADANATQLVVGLDVVGSKV